LKLQRADDIAHQVWNGSGDRVQRTIGEMRQLAGIVLDGGKGSKEIAGQLGLSIDDYIGHFKRYADAMRERVLR